MKDDRGLERLIALARRGRLATNSEPPFGFATRVAARAFSGREDPLFVWERVARKFLVAALLIALCVGTGIIRPRAQQSNKWADATELNESAENLW